MLYRTAVRQKAQDLITAALTGAGATTLDSSDIPIPSGSMPTVLLYTDDDKEGLSEMGAPTFRTTVTLTIQITAERDTKDLAVAQAETINDTIEQALFGSPDFTKLFEKFDRVQSGTDYRGTKNKLHIVNVTMVIEGHATEIFDPEIDTDLTGVNIYVDALNVFDPSGTYEPPFDYTPTAAPRTIGPDGRIEIAAKVDLPD